MSKKKSGNKKPRRSTLNAVYDAASIARAMGARTLGMYPDPAAAAMAAKYGAMTLGMYGNPVAGKMKSPAKKLTAAEKAARSRVRKARSAYFASASRAARLPGKKKRTAKKVTKKVASRAAAPAARRAAKPAKPKLRTVTMNSVINNAAKEALKRWACEGPKRSGCGAGGSRVVNHPKNLSSLVRIRPLRVMTAG